MKPKSSQILPASMFFFAASAGAAPLGTAFADQGRLNNGANPVTGNYDLRFRLLDTPAGGRVLGTLTNAATAVSNGFFTGAGRRLEERPNPENGLHLERGRAGTFACRLA